MRLLLLLLFLTSTITLLPPLKRTSAEVKHKGAFSQFLVFKNPNHLPPNFPNTQRTNLVWRCGWQTSVHYNSNDIAWPYRRVCAGHEIIVSTNLVDWETYAVTDEKTFQYPLTNAINGISFFMVGSIGGSGCCAESKTIQEEEQPIDSIIILIP